MVEIIKDKSNEDELINSGGEITQDQLNNIKLIERPIYNKLPEKEKPDWTRYSPSLTSEAMLLALNSVNEMIGIFNQLGPMISKLSPLTQGGMDLVNGMGFMNLVEAVKAPVEAAKALESIIGTIAGTPIVSIVAEPLKLILGLIASLAGIIYSLIMNPLQLIQAYYKAIKAIDLTELKERMSTETSPNLSLLTTELETINIPDEEIKDFFVTNVKSMVDMVATMTTMLDQALAIEETMDALNEADKNTREVLKAINTMGLSWIAPGLKELFDVMEVDFDKITKELDNSESYKKKAEKFTKSANDFLNNLPQKYIKVSDLELMKNYEKEQENKKKYQNGYKDGYDEGEEKFEEYLENHVENQDVGMVNVLDMDAFKKVEWAKLKEEFITNEKDDNWINGYEKGFGDGFQAMYENIDKKEYNEGYEDGSDQGIDDCRDVCDEEGTDKFKGNAEGTEITNYIVKMLQKTDFNDKSSPYHSGYTEGYDKAFREEYKKLLGGDYDEGYEDGLKRGEKDCEKLYDENGADVFKNSDLDEDIERDLTIELNLMGFFGENGSLKDESEKYQNGYTDGYTKAYREALVNLQKEDAEEGKEDGIDEGEDVCDEFLIEKSSTYILGITLDQTNKKTNKTDLNTSLTNTKTSIDKDIKKNSVYKDSYKSGVWEGFVTSILKNQQKMQKAVDEANQKNGETAGHTAGKTAGSTACSTYNDGAYKKLKEDADAGKVNINGMIVGSSYFERWYVRLTYFGNNHDSVKPTNSEVQNTQAEALKDKTQPYIDGYLEGYDIGWTKGYYEKLKTLKKPESAS